MKVTVCHQCGTELENGTHQCFSCRKKEYLNKKTPANTLPTSVPKLLVDALSKSDFSQITFDLDKSYYFQGKTGAGKSYEAAMLLFHLLKPLNKFAGEWVNVSKFLFDIRRQYNNKEKYEGPTEGEILDRYATVQHLVLDDLGAEKSSDWATQILYLIINERYENMRHIIITSNLTIKNLGIKMGDDRLSSRINGMCESITMGGIDRREKK